VFSHGRFLQLRCEAVHQLAVGRLPNRTLQNLFRAGNGELGDLAAQLFLGTIELALDFSLCCDQQTLAFFAGFLLGVFDDDTGLLARLLDNSRRFLFGQRN